MLKLRRLTRPSVALAVLGLLALPLGAGAHPAAPTAPTAPTPPTAPRAPMSATWVEAAESPAPPEAPEAPEPPTLADDFVWFGDLDEGSMADASMFDAMDEDALAPDETPLPPDDGEGLMAMGLPGDAAAAMAMRFGPGRTMVFRGRGLGANPELMAALKLTDTQKQRLADLRDQRRRTAIEARADLEIAALDLSKLMREERPDRSAIEAQVDKIAQRRAALRKAEIGSMLDMREVLTAQQREALKQKREEMRERRVNVIRDRIRTRDGVRRDGVRTRRPGAGMDSQ